MLSVKSKPISGEASIIFKMQRDPLTRSSNRILTREEIMNTFITCATYFVIIVGGIFIVSLIYHLGPFLNPVRKYKLQIVWLTLKKELLKLRPEFLKKSWWVSDFPNAYHPKCFGCNCGPKTCPKCQYRSWGEEPNSVCRSGKWIILAGSPPAC